MYRLVTLMFLSLVLHSALYSAAPKELPATLRYKIDLKIDYRNEKLLGNCEITISNGTSNSLNEIPLLLYRLLTVKSVEDENGTPLTFKQDIVSVSGWEILQVNFINISLLNSLSPGKQKKVKIVYDGFITGYSNEGWRYVKDHIAPDFTIIRPDGFGYPVIGYPNEADMMAIVKERFDYGVSVTVPENLIAVSGGELMHVENNKNEKTYTYQSKKPSWRIDIAIADYLLTEKDRNKVYCFRADTAGAVKMLNALKKSVEKYSEWFGEIKDFKGYTIIEVPEGYGSQADVTSFCITADNFRNPKDNNAIYHEISHLWNVKPLDKLPCRFESEGLAQFMQFLLSEQIDQNPGAVSGAVQKYINNIQKAFREKPEYQEVPVKDYGVSDMTQYSYTLGMVIFALYFDLTGQESFNKALRAFFSTYGEKGATLDDFIACCKKYSGFDTQNFFNDWIYTTNGVKQIVEGTTYEKLRAAYGRK